MREQGFLKYKNGTPANFSALISPLKKYGATSDLLNFSGGFNCLKGEWNQPGKIPIFRDRQYWTGLQDTDTVAT